MTTDQSRPTLRPAVAVLRGQAVGSPRDATQRLSVVITKLMVYEFLVVAGSAYLASFMYQEIVLQEWPAADTYVTSSFFVAALGLLMAIVFGQYSNLQAQPRHKFLWSGFGTVALAFSFLLSTLFLFKVAEPYSRATFVFQFITVSIAVFGVRAFAHSRLQSAIAAGLVDARRVVLIGDSAACAQFSNRLSATGIRAIGSYASPGCRDRDDNGDPGYEGSELRRLIDGCRRLRPDDIVILANQESVTRMAGLVGALSEVPAGLHIVLIEAADLLAAARIVEFGDTVTMQVSQPPLSTFDRAAKRSFDIIVSVAALIVFSPLLLLVSLAIKLDSRGPVLFRQTRHGYNNETIKVFKFRSMTKLEDGEKFVQATKNDWRITRVGRILRRSNIDELPQLINVLRGEMSIVGPRPHATAHNEMFERQISVFSRRHVVKPGITGWAQVNGFRGETDTLGKMQRRVEYDLYYIDNWSFLFDLRIIIMTLVSKAAYTNAY
jgi:Undecaprenyl-phosphate glucose phosphotransferase